MQDYPLSTLTQATNYFQDEYKYNIANIDDFKNMIHVYRCQYWEQHGKIYTPNKKDLEEIRREYGISLYPKDFTPNPEIIIEKIIESEDNELERLRSIKIALQSRRY